MPSLGIMLNWRPLLCCQKVNYEKCPKYGQISRYVHIFGQIMDVFWTRRKIVQNKIGFRHILGTICMFGHFLDMLWTNHGVWTHLGHIMDMFYQNVSKKCPSPHRAPAPNSLSVPTKSLQQSSVNSSMDNIPLLLVSKGAKHPSELKWEKIFSHLHSN